MEPKENHTTAVGLPYKMPRTPLAAKGRWPDRQDGCVLNQ